LKKVIEEILDTEREGRNRVEEARKQAREMVVSAESEAAKLRQEAHEAALVEAKTLLDNAEAEARKEKEKMLNVSGEATASLMSRTPDEIARIAETLFHHILGQEP